MKKIEYLSPSAIDLWESNRLEFYLRYLSEQKTEKIPQTQPMAVGAAFDAFVKSYLTGLLRDGGMDLEKMLENQVEEHQRVWGRAAGSQVFSWYKDSGALADFVLELQGSEERPEFEIEIRDRVVETLGAAGVVLLGKPDAFYRSRGGARVIHDWKVNGYCSSASPKKGYMQLYDAGKRMGFHKNSVPKMVDGLYVNNGEYLEDIDRSWARQTTIYSWILGAEVGEDFIVSIHQLVFRNGKMRVGVYKNNVGEKFQKDLWNQILEIWDRIQEGKIFDSDNEARIRVLEDTAFSSLMR